MFVARAPVSGGQRFSSIQAIISGSTSQPKNSPPASASSKKWRSSRPAPDPKSSMRRSSKLQSEGRMSRIAAF